MRKYLGYAISGLILLLLTVSGIYLPKAMLLYSGYCFEKERYLTTQEKFDIVVTHITNRKEVLDRGQYISYDPPEEGWRHAYAVNEDGGKVWLEKVVKTSLRYSSLDEFYALNPNCCELVEIFTGYDAWTTIPFWYRLAGRINIIVRVFYIYDFDRDNNNQPIYKEEYFALSNCGEFYWNTIDL